jgi:hypothetical protein
MNWLAAAYFSRLAAGPHQRMMMEVAQDHLAIWQLLICAFSGDGNLCILERG